MTATSWLAVAALLASGPTLAQVLAQPGASFHNRMAVTQLGLPEDGRFVFCRTQDCPERSIKHLALAPQAAPRPMPDPPLPPPVHLPSPLPLKPSANEPASAAVTCERLGSIPKPVKKHKPKRPLKCKSTAR